MNYRKKLKAIKAMLFDLDGVFFKSYMFSNALPGSLIKSKDGLAVNYAIKKDFRIGIISGSKAQGLNELFKELGITDIYLGTQNKLDALEDFVAKYSLPKQQILYMGDDLPDYEVMKNVGFSASPADAANEILEIADYIADTKSGEGCVREIIEQTMKVQQKWDVKDFK